MREVARIARIGYKLMKLWHYFPDWRLCQLLSNLKGNGPQDLFYFEDDRLEVLIDQWLERMI